MGVAAELAWAFSLQDRRCPGWQHSQAAGRHSLQQLQLQAGREAAAVVQTIGRKRQHLLRLSRVEPLRKGGRMQAGGKGTPRSGTGSSQQCVPSPGPPQMGGRTCRGAQLSCRLPRLPAAPTSPASSVTFRPSLRAASSAGASSSNCRPGSGVALCFGTGTLVVLRHSTLVLLPSPPSSVLSESPEPLRPQRI